MGIRGKEADTRHVVGAIFEIDREVEGETGDVEGDSIDPVSSRDSAVGVHGRENDNSAVLAPVERSHIVPPWNHRSPRAVCLSRKRSQD